MKSNNPGGEGGREEGQRERNGKFLKRGSGGDVDEGGKETTTTKGT